MVLFRHAGRLRHMVIRQLHETLARLHEQLASADSLDTAEREGLEQAMKEIQASLAKLGEAPSQREPLPETSATPLDQLKALVGQFEQQHPALSNRLADLAELLHDLGF